MVLTSFLFVSIAPKFDERRLIRVTKLGYLIPYTTVLVLHNHITACLQREPEVFTPAERQSSVQGRVFHTDCRGPQSLLIHVRSEVLDMGTV